MSFCSHKNPAFSKKIKILEIETDRKILCKDRNKRRLQAKAPFTLRKKMGPDQIFLPCKPSVPCFHEIDPDSLFSGFGAIGGYGPKTEKKKSPDPFRCSKALCKRIVVPYHLLHMSLPCFTVVSRLCTLHFSIISLTCLLPV